MAARVILFVYQEGCRTIVQGSRGDAVRWDVLRWTCPWPPDTPRRRRLRHAVLPVADREGAHRAWVMRRVQKPIAYMNKNLRETTYSCTVPLGDARERARCTRGGRAARPSRLPRGRSACEFALARATH